MSKSIKTNVFISWSGETSLKHAQVLKDLIRGCFSHAEVFISTEMDRGSKWLNQISDKLGDAKVGIVCLTYDNKESPWIMYESGALAAGFSKDRVCTVLIGGLQNTDVKEPLAQYNHTAVHSKTDVRSLLDTINKASDEELFQEKHDIDNSFNVWWPQIKKRFDEIETKVAQPRAKKREESRPVDDMVREVLTVVRADRKVMQDLHVLLKDKNIISPNNELHPRTERPPLTTPEMIELQATLTSRLDGEERARFYAYITDGKTDSACQHLELRGYSNVEAENTVNHYRRALDYHG